MIASKGHRVSIASLQRPWHTRGEDSPDFAALSTVAAYVSSSGTLSPNVSSMYPKTAPVGELRFRA